MRVRLVLVLLALCVPFASPSRATMSISLQPEIAYVDPGEVFPLDLTVDYSDSLFNGYEVVLQWDPARLHYVDVQAGPLMPPDFWFEITAGEDSVRIRHVITYGIYGPGVVCRLILQGEEISISEVTVRRATFSYGGQWFYHPVTHGSIVNVLDPILEVGQGPERDQPVLRVLPNPAAAASRIRARLPDTGPAEVLLLDPSGRILCRRSVASMGSGPLSVDIPLAAVLEGKPLCSGMYGLLITSARSRASTWFSVIR